MTIRSNIKTIQKPILLLLLVALTNGCAKEEPPKQEQAKGEEVTEAEMQTTKPATKDVVSCEKLEGMTPYCDFKNPEDLVLLPDGKKLLVSEMGEFMLDTPGALVLLNLASRKKENINIQWKNSGEYWGEENCPSPDIALFSPHGIDLMKRSDGMHQLLVVNHGGRESVEFFALTQLNDDSNSAWQLEWKGCAIPPEDPFINDVAGLTDGGFLVTHMWNKSQPFEAVVVKILAGVKTGWVWAWDPDTGFSKLPGSEEQMPNGIVVSKDNKSVFINIYIGNKVIKLDRLSGERMGEFAVQQPDNITLDDDGQLWVASHKHNPITQNCNEVEFGPCLLPFEIIKADSETLKTEVVLSHEGEPMGYSTVALKVGNEIFMGSAHGDRIVSFNIP